MGEMVKKWIDNIVYPWEINSLLLDVLHVRNLDKLIFPLR